MKNSLFIISSLFCSALAFGCADDKDQNTTKTSVTSVGNPTSDSDSSATDPATGTDPGTSNPGSATEQGTGTDAVTSTASEPTSTTCSFLGCGTGTTGGTDFGCDPFMQDTCPDGEKCEAVITDGGNAWNGTACVPVSGSGQAGDACVSESVAAGLDDCDKGFMCWAVDDMGMGTCVALCTGSPDAPVCPDNGNCTIVNDGALNLCLQSCSPLLQDCAMGTDACYPTPNGFTCAPNASGDTGVQNDPCAFINVCQPGLFCGSQMFVGSGCTNADGCCTAFCDLTQPDPCKTAANPDASCVPWFDPMMPIPIDPPDAADIGVCGVPG